jgi:hypothetical protein
MLRSTWDKTIKSIAVYVCAKCENVLYVCDSMEGDYPNYKYYKYYVMLHGNILDIIAKYLVIRA